MATLVLSTHPPSSPERITITVTANTPAYLGRLESRLNDRISRSTGGVGYPIASERVSGVHCKIYYDAATNAFYVRDLKSANGTLLLSPSSKGYTESFIGAPRTAPSPPPPAQLSPLSVLILAGEVRCIVQRIMVPFAPAGSFTGDMSGLTVTASGAAPGAGQGPGHGGGPDGSDGTVVSSSVVSDMALHVIAGPGSGTTFVLTPGHKYVVGRASSAAHVSGCVAGVVRLRLAFPDGTPRAVRHELKRSHALVEFLNAQEQAHGGVEAKFKVSAHKGGLEYAVRSRDDPLDLDAMAWEPLSPGTSLLFSYDDVIRAGPVAFLVTENNQVPRKLAPPHIQARSPHDLLLSWGQGPSASAASSSIIRYTVQYSSVRPVEAEPADLRLTQVRADSLLITDLEPDTRYYVRVRAHNSAGPGIWSETATFMTTGSWSDNDTDSDSEYDYGPDDDDEPGDAPADTNGAALPPWADNLTATEVMGSFAHRDGSALSFVKTKILGKGGQGVVFLGVDTEDGAMYAVKEMYINSASASEVENVDLLVETVKKLQDLDSPHIVRYAGVARTDNTLRIFLEYCPSGSLRSMLDNMPEESQGLPELLAVLYTRQILSGIAYLHENNIIHRDIKAANVLFVIMGDKTYLKLADFGLAWHSETATGSKGTVGTPYYMSPEVVRNEPPKPSGDIWALGCTVYEMLVGQPPLVSLGPIRAMYMVGKGGEHLRNGHLVPQHVNVSPQCAAFLAACMSLDPEDRPSAVELMSHEWLSAAAASPHLGPAP